MKYSLEFSVEAETDILGTISWYNNEKKDLGFQFYNQLSTKISLMVKNPLNYSIRFANIRATKVSRYPYLIYFKLNEQKSSIVVLAVLHTSRDPKEITKRK